MRKAVYLLLCFCLLLSACVVASSGEEPSISPVSVSVSFPIHLRETVTLPTGVGLKERQLAYCEHTQVVTSPEDRWRVAVSNPLDSQTYYVDNLVPQATTSDLGCLDYPPSDDNRDVSGLDWSPDGNQLLYSLSNDIIVLANIAPDGQTEDVAEFLNPPKYTFYRYAHAPTWSPQGTHVAFISKFQEGPVEIGQAVFAPSVFVAEADGSDPRFFVQEKRLPGIVSNPAWSNDGARLAYVLRVPANGIGIIELNSGNVRQLDAHTVPEIPEGTIETHGILPPDSIAWVPGDKLILFLTNSESEAEDILWVMETDGSNPIKLYQDNIQQIQLSPDGKTLAMVLGEGIGQYRIVNLTLEADVKATDILKSAQWEYTNSTDLVVRDLDWSPDGRYLAFAANPKNNFDLFTWDAKEQQIIQLTNTPNLDELAPHWRPITEDPPN